MQNQVTPRPISAWLLILMNAFLGLNALAAGAAFLIAPDGHLIQMPLSNLNNSPFSDFFIPGILLFAFLGIYPMAVAYSLWKKPAWRWPDALNPFKQIHWSWAGSLAAGVILMIWIIVQIQYMSVGLLHELCLGWGAWIVVVTLLPTVRRFYRLAP